MGDILIYKINIICNDSYIKESLQKNHFKNLYFSNTLVKKIEEDITKISDAASLLEFKQEEIPAEIVLKIIGRNTSIYPNTDLNILVLNSEKDIIDKNNLDYNSFDIILHTGNNYANPLNPDKNNDFMYMYVPKLDDCINFIKFLYLSFNSYHAISYDHYSDIFSQGNIIIKSVCTNNYEELVNFIKGFIESNYKRNKFIICSKEYDYSNSINFLKVISRSLDKYENMDINVFPTVNYNLEEKNNYYLAFIINSD